ncbi:MAG: TIGR00282 family metallophosphoesterase [Oscillospiraceae bacterium]|nr:TIGR00282 family metallophosphoesterase [Oscillospiraceae bacterium]
MDYRILAVGDVVAQAGISVLQAHLRTLKKLHNIDFCIVNGENAAMTGLTPRQADELLDAGADVITLGNHAWAKREICSYLDDCRYILRPANLAPQRPGRGWGVFPCRDRELAVVNLIGRCGMDFGADNPFTALDAIRKQTGDLPLIVDFHAEATSEKLAMGYDLDGKAAAVFGTHTHVPTADARVLPKGTGYVTDLGMTGPAESVLGIRPEQSIALFRGELTKRFEPADGKRVLQSVLFTIDGKTNRCKAAERLDLYD